MDIVGKGGAVGIAVLVYGVILGLTNAAFPAVKALAGIVIGILGPVAPEQITFRSGDEGLQKLALSVIIA